MSVTSLPEWKQLLLERKRREEEARERKEKQEEEKLANMPAWKRGIIQRRKAKQESPGEVFPVEARSPSDGLSDTDSSVTVNLGSDVSLSPDPGMWLDDSKQASQVCVETIVPVNENPFIRIQRKKGREAELCSPKSYEGEPGRGRDIEIKLERFRDLSEGRDKEQSSKQSDASWDRSVTKEKDRNQRRQDNDFLKVRKDDEDRDSDSASPVYSPIVPCLRTIRADNIIIIEQERKSNNERRGGRWKEAERDRSEEMTRGDQTKRGLKMDLKEILAGGGSVTEIRASEVLIIKPPVASEDRTKAREDAEKTDGKREARELRADMSWLKEKVKESVKEKERPWGQATVIKEDKKDNLDDTVFVEKGGRVSQLLSKFGEHRKPPSRSKSSDNLKPAKNLGDNDEEDEREDSRSAQLKGVPKRSFSFSDRVFSSKENGFEEEGKMRDRIHLDKAHWMEMGSLGKDTAGKIKMGCARLLEKDRFGKHRHWQNKEKQHRNEGRNQDTIDGEEGFTVACVKNIENISFAKRVPIRQEGKARAAEREAKKLENLGVEKGAKVEGEDYESKIQASNKTDANYRHESAFRECSSLLCTVQDNSNRTGLAWSESGTGTPLSQQKEEQVEDSKVYRETERGEKLYKIAFEVTKNIDGAFPANVGPGNQDAKTLTRTSTLGVQPAPLEIQIPRTVFYLAEEMVEKKKPSDVQDWEGGREVERRDSWRVGKPLSRIESLKEKIRQQQLEIVNKKEAKEDEEDIEVAEICDTAATTMAEIVAEEEVESQIRKSMAEVEKEVALQTSVPATDVTQEVSISEHSPQLPVYKSQADEGEEVESGGGTESCGQVTEDEDETVKNEKVSQEEGLEEEKQLSEEDLEELTANFESEESLSPSPPSPNSLEAMSRIYNLETVGSRSGLCLRDRTMEIPSVHLIKIKPLNSQQGESCGVQTIQRHIENFKLREQEALKSQSCTSANSVVKETKVQHSPRGKTVKEEVTAKDKDKESSPILSPKRDNSPDQTITINSSILRCQSPENALKILDLAPTPASSPCSPSPAQSPNNSPSPSPTPTLFTIKSASGRQVKRGATITVTPKKLPAQGSPAPVSMSTTRTTSPLPKTTPTTTTTSTAESAKKKYPTVDEIEVIGGYQNLDKSCLVKNKGTPKKVKVCFAEERLEQLCEYPSETSMLAGSPYPQDLGWTDGRDRGEDNEEEEMETVTIVTKATRSVGTATGRGLRVGKCHPLLKKHSV